MGACVATLTFWQYLFSRSLSLYLPPTHLSLPFTFWQYFLSRSLSFASASSEESSDSMRGGPPGTAGGNMSTASWF